MGQKLGGSAAFLGRGAGSPSNKKVAWAEAYVHTKWNLDHHHHHVCFLISRQNAASCKIHTVSASSIPACIHLDVSSRLSTIDMGRKLGRGALPPCWGGAGSPTQCCVWAEAYLRTNWHLDPCSRLATTDMGRKLGILPPFGGRRSGSLGRKLGILPPFGGRGSGSLSDTK